MWLVERVILPGLVGTRTCGGFYESGIELSLGEARIDMSGVTVKIEGYFSGYDQSA